MCIQGNIEVRKVGINHKADSNEFQRLYIDNTILLSNKMQVKIQQKITC